MASLWERLKSRFSMRSKEQRAKRPLAILDEYNQRLFASTDRLAHRYRELSEVRAKLENHSESLRRILQRYDEQARKHYKNNQKELAETALREKLKHQVELDRLARSIQELDKHIESMKAHKERLQAQLQLYKIRKEAIELRYDASKTELETRELQMGYVDEELPNVQSAIDEAEYEIEQIQIQLEAARELERDSPRTLEQKLGDEISTDSEEIRLEIERLRNELLEKRKDQTPKKS